MKKLILLAVIVVLVLSISVFSLMGCQGQTSLTQIFSEENIWLEATFPETFTYTMRKDGSDAAIGTLTMQVTKLNTNATYYLGKNGLATADDYIYAATTASGNATYMATNTLTLLDGSYSQETIAIFANNYKMLITYSKIIDGGKETTFVASNVEDGKHYFYKTNADWSDENKIKSGKYESAPYFDNTMVYYVARSIPNDSTYASFSFNIFNHDTNKKEKVALTNSCDIAEDIVIGSTSFSCRKIRMTTSDILLGTTNNVTCYVTYAPYGKSKQVITKIQEGAYTYTLNI